jgi:UDP-3-O-[3-hydroxymyristoyl] glucosamine N-acyltransferase
MFSVLKSLLVLSHVRSRSKYFLPVKCGKNLSIEFDTNSVILFHEQQSRLYLNKSWTKKTPFSSHLTMGKNSRMEVNGIFSFYYNSNIGIYPEATFSLGSGFVNYNALITVYRYVKIGYNVIIGPNCVIRDTDDHTIDAKQSFESIDIKDNVWIGTNVTILKGVTIGEGAIIAAFSLVNKSVPPFSLAGGIPAKIIRENVKWT